jgi:peptide/nickel transport system permease protein
MLKYILRRIFVFIPTLIIISLLAFTISINAPGDPVERMLNRTSGGGEQLANLQNTVEQKRLWTHKLGLDLPVFYISLTNVATPDTLYKILDPLQKNAAKRLIAQTGNWEAIETWRRAVLLLNNSYDTLQPDSATIHQFGQNAVNNAFALAKNDALSLLTAYEPAVIQSKLNGLQSVYAQFRFFSQQQNLLTAVAESYNYMAAHKEKWKNSIPAIRFYKYNQYHRWIFGDGNWLTGKGSTYCKGIIRGDFGLSYQTQLPIIQVIKERMPWSLTFTIISVLLAYIISLPIGIKAAAKKNSLFDRTSSVVLFILYSMPAFWVATLLLMTFANPHILQIFPASGVQPVTGVPDDAGFFKRISMYLPHLILPTICYTYAQLAFLSRITRVSTLEVIAQDYIRTARAKGLNESKVIYKHAFRNALLPVITVLSNILPLAIGGSVILETIFTIPGMGIEVFLAISNKDYPMIITVFTITGVLTLIGYLIADLLYAVADPRITYK